MISIDLSGKKALIVGIGDDKGFGFAIAKALAQGGADILIGTWTPLIKIFTSSWESGKFDEARILPNGDLWNYKKIYSIDVAFDSPADVPSEIKENKRYTSSSGYTISEVADQIKKDFGTIDILVHAVGFSPEVTKPLLETSRQGYHSALSSSSYSFISLLSHLGPIMEHGSALTLSYIASTRVIPGYGGGMSSAKAALESDIRTLAFETGRKWDIRVNGISAGPWKSRAAKAIGMIDQMITYSLHNAPLTKDLHAEEIAAAATFLLSPLASAITGEVLFVDNGLHAMGMAIDSKSLQTRSS